MENFEIRALIALMAVFFAMVAAGWTQFLAHMRRMKTLDVIKSAYEQGREPPPDLYRQLGSPERERRPWGEVVIFTALAVGFWIAAATAPIDDRNAFVVVAASMTVTALGCLVLALWRPGGAASGRGAADDAG